MTRKVELNDDLVHLLHQRHSHSHQRSRTVKRNDLSSCHSVHHSIRIHHIYFIGVLFHHLHLDTTGAGNRTKRNSCPHRAGSRQAKPTTRGELHELRRKTPTQLRVLQQMRFGTKLSMNSFTVWVCAQGSRRSWR